MSREQITVALEIGTTKVSALVAQCYDDGDIHLLGIGEAPSRGVRKGEIVDFITACDCVRDALADAEDKSDAKIGSVYLAMTGSHIRSFNNRSCVNVPEDKGEITDIEIEAVEAKAKEISLPKENLILHSIIQHYFVDGQAGVLNPVGMLGSRLEADFHVIHGVTNRIQNSIRCVKECGVDVEDVVMSSIASAQSVLNQNQKDSGAMVVDIGGGVTDFIVYLDGAVHISGVLAVGGDHITNDISVLLKLPIGRAEKLKVDEGSTLINTSPKGGKIVLKSGIDFAGRELERDQLNRIIHARVLEIFQLLRRQLPSEAYPQLLGGGITLTGGCSQLRGVRELAEEVFGVPVRLARSQPFSGPTSALENPQLSTTIGLLKYAQAVRSETPGESFVGGIFREVKRFFRLPF